MYRDQRKAPHHADVRSLRRNAAAVVSLTYSQSRYPLGEVVIQTTYRLSDGSQDAVRPHRVYLGRGTGPAIRALWNALFDAAALAHQFEPCSLTIRLHPEDFPIFWEVRVRALAEAVADELHAVVAGTAFDSGLT